MHDDKVLLRNLRFEYAKKHTELWATEIMYEIEPDICLEILGGDLLSRFLSQPSEKSNSLANFLMSTLDRQFI